jgi:hypothetical protein
MKRSTHPVRARLEVESLDPRELPSSFLADGLPANVFSSSPAQPVQAREAARRMGCNSHLTQILSSTDGLRNSSISAPGTVSVAFYTKIIANHNQTLVRVRSRKRQPR